MRELHLSKEELGHLNIDDLFSLAIMSDKYDCVRAVRAQIVCSLQPWIGHDHDWTFRTTWKVAATAYLIGWQSGFQEIIQVIVEDLSREEIAMQNLEALGLPEEVRGS